MTTRKNIGLIILMMLVLAACGANPEELSTDTGDSAVIENGEELQDEPIAEGSRQSFRENIGNDELSPALQLAAGTILLDSTEIAVDPDQAEKLIPYWKLFVNLLESDTTAPEELEAIVNEIPTVMTAEQMAYIVDLELVLEDVVNLMNELGLDVSLRADGEEGGIGRNRPEGLPEGTRPGGGAGGGTGSVEGLDPELLATMEARREEMGGTGGMGTNRLQIPVIEAMIEMLEGLLEN